MSITVIITQNKRRNWHTANGSASIHMLCRFISSECLIPRWDNPDWQNFSKFSNLVAIFVPSHPALSLEETSPGNVWVSDAEPKVPSAIRWQRLCHSFFVPGYQFLGVGKKRNRKRDFQYTSFWFSREILSHMTSTSFEMQLRLCISPLVLPTQSLSFTSNWRSTHCNFWIIFRKNLHE